MIYIDPSKRLHGDTVAADYWKKGNWKHLKNIDYQSRALFGWWTVDEAWFLQKNPSEKSCSPFLVIRGTLASGWGILEGRILSAENLTHGQLWIGPTSGSTPLGECGVGLKILGHPQQNLASQASHHCPDDCIWWPFRDIRTIFGETHIQWSLVNVTCYQQILVIYPAMTPHSTFFTPATWRIKPLSSVDPICNSFFFSCANHLLITLRNWLKTFKTTRLTSHFGLWG